MSNLDAIFAKLIAESTAQKTRGRPRSQAKVNIPAEPSPRELRFARLDSSRWTDEALVMILSRGRCSCGRVYEYPHPQLFVKRFHPSYGVHFEAMKCRPRFTSLPYRVELDDHDLPACPACFTQSDADLAQKQMMLPLFSSIEVH